MLPRAALAVWAVCRFWGQGGFPVFSSRSRRVSPHPLGDAARPPPLTVPQTGQASEFTPQVRVGAPRLNYSQPRSVNSFITMKKMTLPRAAQGRLYSAAAFVLVDCLLGALAWSRWSRTEQPASAVLGASEVVGVVILVTVLVAFVATVRSGPKWMSVPAACRATLIGRIVAVLRMVGLIVALAILAMASGGPDVSGLYLLALGLVDAIMAVAFTNAIASELPTPDGRAPSRRKPSRSKTPTSSKTSASSKTPKSPKSSESSETSESSERPAPPKPRQTPKPQQAPKAQQAVKLRQSSKTQQTSKAQQTPKAPENSAKATKAAKSPASEEGDTPKPPKKRTTSRSSTPNRRQSKTT